MNDEFAGNQREGNTSMKLTTAGRPQYATT